MRAGILVLAAALTLAAAAPAAGAEWLAGDGHVHTCYSHDAYCGPGDDSGPEEFYSFGGTVPQRFSEASSKGLDFLVISDHDDIRAHADPAFGSSGVTGIHAYEASISGGHAQMIGARKLYAEGNGSSLATIAMADALRGDGGVFQANHPGYRLGRLPETCEHVASPDYDMHWTHAFTVPVDTIEVWNATTLLQPSELYWECWLQRGARIGALAGSDSHGANHANISFPMTWAFAASRSEADVLKALRAGRTTLARIGPKESAVRLLLEADVDRDGQFDDAMIGDQVPPKTRLQVRADNLPGPGLLRIRANGRTAFEGARLAPGGTVAFEAPAEPGWVRASLYLEDGTAAVDPLCAPPPDSPFPEPFDEVPASPISGCSEDLAMAALTSPIWIGTAAQAPKVDPPGPPPPPGGPEPDSQPPLPPAQQGGQGRPPDVPPQRDRPAAVAKLRATWFRAAAARHRSLRVRLRWKAPEGPFDVQVRRPGTKRWKVIAAGTHKRQRIVRLRRGRWKLRVRATPPQAPAGPWRSLTIRL